MHHLKVRRDKKFKKLKLNIAKNRTPENWNAYRDKVQALANEIDDDEAREWLHAQAIVLGGLSEKGNLVVGAYGANRTMLAIEMVVNQFRNNYASSTYSISTKITCTNVTNTLVAENIRYKVVVSEHNKKGQVVKEEIADFDINAYQAKFPTGSGWRKKFADDLRTFFGMN